MLVGLARKDTSKRNEFSTLSFAFVLESWETEHKTRWVKQRQSKKSKNIFAYVLTMVKKGFGFGLPCFIIPFKVGTWKRETRYNSEWVKQRQSQKSKNIFVCIIVIVRKSSGFNLPGFIFLFKLISGKERQNNIVKYSLKENHQKVEILSLDFLLKKEITK